MHKCREVRCRGSIKERGTCIPLEAKNRKDLREDSGQVKTENEGMIRYNGNRYRDPDKAIVQREPKWNLSFKSLPPGNTPSDVEGKSVKARRDGISE